MAFTSLQKTSYMGIKPLRALDLLLLTLSALLLSTSTQAEDATSSASQLSTPFVDQITGLPMERFFGARTTFGFALAMPTLSAANASATTSSFIGQLTFPLKNGVGWGAMGLTGDMEGNFILAAWPDGNGGVMASFRQATNEDNPPEVTGKFAVRPIPDGTSVNATFLTYTFLCENCIDASLGLNVDAQGNAVMGWALSERPPRGNAADAGAFLDFHERGFGPFTARLGLAATDQFDAVAATALDPVPASSKAVAAVAGAAGEGSGDDGGDSDDEDGGSGNVGGGRGGGGGGNGGNGGNSSGDDSDDDD